tara:strand:+ start:4363 stop:7230 length:2868 start_codon:yes stop_codon:yes gene_type:complete
MITEFYRKALPSSGVYCVASIDPVNKIPRHKFVESIDEIESVVNGFIKKNQNVFVALSSFSGYSRKADDAKYIKSFFVDLDVGKGKGYESKEAALEALEEFVQHSDLPPPVKLDSGTGIHAYWLFDRDIEASEWKPYAEKFKNLCIDRGLRIDPVVTADLARILRCPDTFNQKTTPPSPTKLIDEKFPEYVFDEFKNFLGVLEPSIESILQAIPKGLSEDQRKMLKLDNFESRFDKIVEVSKNGQGCQQIKFIVENVATLPEPLWYSGLSIAQHCEDRETAIHTISQDYPNYNAQDTAVKANQTQGMPHSCDTFSSVNPEGCKGCAHRGKITNPLALGKVFKAAETPAQLELHIEVPLSSAEAVEKTGVATESQSRGLTSLPQELYPYVYGKAGGIYCMPPDKYDEDGNAIHGEPILVTLYDLFPLKRIYSPTDGDCLLMKAVLPNDPEREFLLPMRNVYAVERLKEIIASQGVLFNSDTRGAQYLMNYIIKWGHYLTSKHSAEIMRMQMGWTPERESFVVGESELTRKGDEISSPTSPLCRGIAKHLKPSGDYQVWKQAANRLNQRTLELHAFTLLTGFGSILMDYTSTSGVTVCLTGESGAAKTGALYGCLSVWGNPKDLSVLEATGNGMTGRYLGLHNIPFGLDEVGNIQPKDLSQLIHKISQGKSKIRMQASINAERDHEMSASMVAVFTSNHSLYDKLTILKKDPNGEVARLIEFSIRKPQIFKDDATMGREIFDKFRFNYGWAGRDFVFNLYKYSDSEVLKMMEAWVTRFRKDFGEDTSYRFYENLVSSTLTAGEIAVKAHIVDYDLDRMYEKIVGEMISIRDNVVKVNEVNYESLVGEFINVNLQNILSFKDNRVVQEPRGPLVIRAEMDNNLIYLSRPDFRKYLSENMVSTREFTFHMEKAGIKVKESKKRMGTGWKDANGSVTVMAYAFSLDKFQDIIEKIDEAKQ